MADGEAGAEIYSAGATKEQAGILFRDAVKMVDKSPDLDSRLKMSGGPGREYNIAYRLSSGRYRGRRRKPGRDRARISRWSMNCTSMPTAASSRYWSEASSFAGNRSCS